MSLKSKKEMRNICSENWKINDYNFLNLVKDINLDFRITAAAAAAAKLLQSCPKPPNIGLAKKFVWNEWAFLSTW